MKEEGILEEEYEFREMRRGRRYKRKNIGDEKGEMHSDP
jgi:hypothetical protein